MNIKVQKAEDNIRKIDFNKVLNVYEHHLTPVPDHNPSPTIKTETSDVRRTRGNSAINRLATAKQELSQLKAREESSREDYLKHVQRKSTMSRTGRSSPFLKSARTGGEQSMTGRQSTRIIHGSMFSTLGIRKSRSTHKNPINILRLSHNPKMVKQEYKHPNKFPQRKVTFHGQQSQVNIFSKQNPRQTPQTSQGQLRLKIIKSMVDQDDEKSYAKSSARYTLTAATNINRAKKRDKKQMCLQGSQVLQSQVEV